MNVPLFLLDMDSDVEKSIIQRTIGCTLELNVDSSVLFATLNISFCCVFQVVTVGAESISAKQADSKRRQSI